MYPATHDKAMKRRPWLHINPNDWVQIFKYPEPEVGVRGPSLRSLVWGAGNSAPRDEFVAEQFRSLTDGKPPEVGASERVVKAYLNKQRDQPIDVLKTRAECPRCYHQENTKSTTFAGMSRCIPCWSPITNYMWRWEPLPMLPLPHGLGSSSAVPDSTGSKSRRRDGDGDTSGAAVP